MDSTGRITAYLFSGIKTSAGQITVGTWTLITVSFAIKGDGQSYKITIARGSNPEDFDDTLTVPTTGFDGQDKFQLGGKKAILGQIAEFQIFSPGASQINTRNIYIYYI